VRKAGGSLPEFLQGEPKRRSVATFDPDQGAEAATGVVQPPGEWGLWVFILGDLTLFGVFFAALMSDRRQDPDGYALAAGQLHLGLGTVNTLLLLTSSYLVVGALGAEKHGRTAARRRRLAGALTCAGAFLVVKVIEYLAVASDDRPSASSSRFLAYFFVLTGIHVLHVLIGAALLLHWRGKQGAQRLSTRFIEGASVYWHMVDILWIMLFSLLYVAVR
jgi:nitric oxide reductase NorE protein